MQEAKKDVIESILREQRKYFSTHQTKDVGFRIDKLKQLKENIIKSEVKISEALWEDLHKSPEETYLTEISTVLQEINYHLKNLKKWTKAKRVFTPLQLLPSKSRIIYEPLGVALIIAPWNYPFQLLFNSLIGAISSGCCAILKPSPHAPNIAMVMQEIEGAEPNTVVNVFQKGYVLNGRLLRPAMVVVAKAHIDTQA